jgi:arginine exporter protein ArgO
VAADLPAAVTAGVLAGLALALPFGALGAMLVDTSLRSSRRVALFAAAGVAVTDLTFALLAALTGAAVTGMLRTRDDEVRLTSAGVVIALGVHAWYRTRRPTVPVPVPVLRPVHGLAPAGTAAVVAVRTRAAAERRAMLRFVLVTAANPLTITTLTAMSAELGARAGLATAVAFAVGCGTVSAGWHGMLALGGNVLGARLSPGLRRSAAYVGAAVTIGLGAHMALVG